MERKRHRVLKGVLNAANTAEKAQFKDMLFCVKANDKSIWQ